MTTVKVTKKDGHIVAVEADGHTGYGLSGEDIVCAALSSVLQTALLGLLTVAGLNVKYKIDDENAGLTFAIDEDLSWDDRKNADMILDTMYAGAADLYENWSDFIDLECIEK